jgi:hypothetical protein
VGAATLSLFAAAAEECPVLAVVDHAHWLGYAVLGGAVLRRVPWAAKGVLLLLGLICRHPLHALKQRPTSVVPSNTDSYEYRLPHAAVPLSRTS